jgi:hypothetical protein
MKEHVINTSLYNRSNGINFIIILQLNQRLLLVLGNNTNAIIGANLGEEMVAIVEIFSNCKFYL